MGNIVKGIFIALLGEAAYCKWQGEGKESYLSQILSGIKNKIEDKKKVKSEE